MNDAIPDPSSSTPPKRLPPRRVGRAALGALAAALLLLGACRSSPLVDPVVAGQYEQAVRLLDQGVPVEGADRKGRTLLELAVLQKKAKIVRLLVERGANVNRVGAYNNSPLQWTAERGTGEMAEILANAPGANPNASGRFQIPPLSLAIDRGHFDVAAVLIEAGADPNAMGPRSDGSPLHYAVRKNRPFLAQQLVAAGANLQTTDRRRQTPLSLAKALGRSGPLLDALEGRLQIARTQAAPPPPSTPPKPRATPPRQSAPSPRPATRRDHFPPKISGENSIDTRAASVEIDLLIRDDSAVREVRVDGRRVTLGADGRLRTTRAVPEGNSSILVTAVDEWGNESSHEIRVARQILRVEPTDTAIAMRAAGPDNAPAPPEIALPAYDFGRYHALVIGNNEYHDLPKLRTAVNDAISVSALLRDHYSYEVETLLNATRADVLGAFSRLRNRLGAGDNLLIFYAGHGWLDKDADQGYWLPTDATRDNPVNWISNSDITASVRAMRANHVMVVADSCYSGKLTRGLAIKSQHADYLRDLAQKRARVVLTSGGLEPVEDGVGNHSIFASAFLDALRTNRSVLEGHDLFQRIRRPVMLGTDQVPDYGDMRRAGHEGGDFLFVRAR